MKDSEILETVRGHALYPHWVDLVDVEATLRKYAAIARAVEAGTHKVVPVEPTQAMLDAAFREAYYDENSTDDNLRNAHIAACQAAPQFQEEWK